LALKWLRVGFSMNKPVMPITLPDLKNTRCISLTACGEIKTTDRALLKWLKSQKKTVFADLNKSKGDTCVTLGLGEYTGKHFHVDVSSSSEKSAFASRLKINQIQEKLEKLIGKEVLVDFKGMFEIEITELPEGGIIKSLFFQTQFGDVAVKMKGAKLSIKGTPVNDITWQVKPDGKKVGIYLEAENLKTIVTENYLNTALLMLESVFKVFVLGKISNESK
jgi:hypothetical protein